MLSRLARLGGEIFKGSETAQALSTHHNVYMGLGFGLQSTDAPPVRAAIRGEFEDAVFENGPDFSPGCSQAHRGLASTVCER